MRVQVNVPEDFAGAVRSGSQAVVTVRSLPGREFPGTVNLASGALDAASRTLLVEVDLSNPGGILVPGMYAEVRLTPAHAPATLRIPGTALLIDAEGSRVALVTGDGRIHLQPVRLGRDFGTETEILDGLPDGAKLVNNPSSLLREGDRVTAQETSWGAEEKHPRR